jgi:hypothetical protein
MADWDGDGDLDLLVGQADGSLLYFERTDSGHLVQLAVEDNPPEPQSPEIQKVSRNSQEQGLCAEDYPEFIAIYNPCIAAFVMMNLE